MSDDATRNRRRAPTSFGDVFNPRKMFVGIFLPEALVATDAISSTAKLVWGHLARRAGENGLCFPSKRDIAKHVGIKERQVGRVLKELVLVRLIRAVPRTDPSGRCTSNEYEFLWHPLLEPSLRGEGVTNDTGESVTQDIGTVTRGSSPRVSSETPLEERQKNHQHQEGEIGREKSAGHSTAATTSEKPSFSKKPDDDEGPKVEFATPVDEIKAIAKAKLGHDMPYEDLFWILDTLELQGVSREEYLAEIRRHVGNHWKNPIGMLKSFVKGFRRKLKPAGPPITKAELEEKNYKCPKCGTTKRGEGAHVVPGGFVPCECASDEFIERLKAKGLIPSSKNAAKILRAPPSSPVSKSQGIADGN